MIKAEVIIHEGNPGPNWLDQCRNLITPGRATTLVVVVAATILVATVMRGENPSATSTAVSQQINTGTSSLAVKPLNDPSTTASSTSLTPQSASKAAPGSEASIANSLGAQSTPSLNNATTPAATKQNTTADPNQLNGTNLTNNVQSTVKSLNQTVQDTSTTVNSALTKLGL